MNTDQINFYLEKTFSQNPSDVAHLIKYLYFSGIRFDSKNWYHFTQHKWIRLDEDQSPLIPIMKNDLVNKYLALANSYNCSVMKLTNELNAVGNVDPDKTEIYLPLIISDLTNKSKICSELGLKLNNLSYIQKVIIIAQELFTQKDFELTLDLNPLMLGFENGIFNLKTMQLEVPTNDANVFMTVGYRYKSESGYMKEVETFFEKLGLEKMLPALACLLSGEIRQPLIWITGLNDKNLSMLVQLFEWTFGDYVGNLPFSTLRKRKIPHFQNHTHTDLANCCRQRIIIVEQTPEDHPSIYQPMLDILLDQDTLDLRMPYNRRSNNYLPQFGVVVLSANPDTEPPKESLIFQVSDNIDITSEPKKEWRLDLIKLLFKFYQRK